MTLGACVQSTVVYIIFNPAYVASSTRGFRAENLLVEISAILTT